MPLFIRKKQELRHLSTISKLSVLSFITSLAAAFTSTIWAVYIDGFVHSIVIVGFITSFFALISFFSHFAIIPIVERANKAKLFAFSLLFFVISYGILAFTNSLWLFLILGTIITIFWAIRATVFGLIVKDKSPKGKLSQNEGVVYTFFNTAFLLGPLIAGFIATAYSNNAIFLISAIVLFAAFVLFKTFKIKDAHVSKTIDSNPVKNFIDFFKDRKRLIAYFISGGLSLWWSLIYIFVPLLIVREGLSEIWIGYFLFAVVIPLILLEYKFSKKAESFGFQKMFKIGYFIAAAIAVACFFVSNIYVILILLSLASIGLAMIEPTSEAYFFDILKKGEANRFYSPFNTALDINYFFAKLLASLILIFLPFKFLFLLFALFMFIMFLVSFKTRNVVEAKRKR